MGVTTTAQASIRFVEFERADDMGNIDIRYRMHKCFMYRLLKSTTTTTVPIANRPSNHPTEQKVNFEYTLDLTRLVRRQGRTHGEEHNRDMRKQNLDISFLEPYQALDIVVDFHNMVSK